MAASQQTSNGIPYPSDSDDVDIAGDMQLLANAVVGNKGNSTINVVSPSIKGLQIDAANTVNAFEVNSTSTGNGVVVNKSSSGNALTVNETGSGIGLLLSSSGSGDALRVTNTGTGNSFVVEDSANPDATSFRIDGDGNVFINNSVTLNGSIDTAGSATFVGNTANSLVRITQEGTGNALLVEDSTNPDSTPFVVDSNGFVGIGTTTPTSNLNIYNSGTSGFLVEGDAGVNNVIYRSSNDSAAGNFFIRKSRGTSASKLAVESSDTIGTILFGAYGGTTSRSVSLIRSAVETYVSDTDISSNLTFHTSPSGAAAATERMRIDSNGNVGIGISIPVAKLDLVGTSNQLRISQNLANSYYGFDAGVGYFDIKDMTDSSENIRLTDNSDIRFTVASAERMIINSSGNVGIGLSIPLYTLHLSSDAETDITLDSSTTSSSASYIIGRKSRGTAAFPTGVLPGDHLLSIGAVGHNGISYPSTYSGEIKISATENHSTTARGAQIAFFTVPNTTTTLRQRFEIDQNGDLYINELTSAIPLSTNVYTTAGTGTNIAGSDITFNAGQSTGSANGGTIHFKTSVAGVSGSSTNSLVNRLSLGAASNLIPAGTTTFAPLQFTSGTNLTTPVNGSVEYDGDKFYTTPNAGTIATTSGRGYIPSIHSAYTQANSAAATTTTPVTPFTAANDTLPVDANKLYKFKGTYYATATWTSGAPAIQIGFTFSNAPVNIKYRYRSHVIAAGTAISLQGQSTVATATTVTGTIGATNSFIIDFEGCFTSNATTGGTILPFFQMSTTGVSTVMTQCSVFEIQKLGPAGTTVVAGNWA